MNFVWNDAAMARLTELHAKGLSGTQIANKLSDEYNCFISRNAVIGKIDRSGLRLKNKIARYLAAPKKPGQRKREAPRPRVKPSEYEPPRFAAYLPPEPMEPETMKRCTLLQLTNKSCRWPIGDPRERDFHFCGNDVAGDGCVYCAYHTRISYTSAADRRADKAATQGAPYYGPQT